MSRETVSARDIGGLGRSRRGMRRIAGPDVGIGQLAEAQHGVVTRRQLRTLGLGEDAIDYRLAIGRLRVVALGVYSVGHSLLPPLGRSMAAVLSSGAEAVLSHHSAAALWGIREAAMGPIHVTVSHKSASSKLVRRHHTTLPDDEVTTHEGVPVTTVPRTVLDLASISPVSLVESAIRQVEYLRLYDQLSLVNLIGRYPGRRGVGRLRLALERVEGAPAGRTRSPLEERFVRFLRRHQLPLPRLNDWIVVGARRFQVDCHWPGTGQVVELDGWRAHGTRSAFREDRTRDRILRTAGYAVTRIFSAQLDDEPEAVAADLRVLLDS